MGVNGLWPILGELCERQPLTYLTGKKVAVDLSGWVVQAMHCKGLNTVKNPHLRNLFFRVSCLLQNGVHLIFVMEGKPPALKEMASRKTFDQILTQCQDLLQSLGVPCIKSSGEAEALCAFLFSNGIVDGVITEDNDAFLYGADIVYRDFSIDPQDSHVNVYNIKSSKNKMHLDREKLVALALLLGCDYVKGVPGVGSDTALKLLAELKDSNILQKFKDWKKCNESELFPGYIGKKAKKPPHCNRCDHLGSVSSHKSDGCELCDSKITCYLNSSVACLCSWHVNYEINIRRKTELKVFNAVKNVTDFPNSKVIEEYLHYSDQIPGEKCLNWNCPNWKEFEEKALSYLGWTVDNSYEKCMPLVTSWQLYSLSKNQTCNKTLIFEPVEIIKERIVKGEDCLEIKWKLNENCCIDVPVENLCTVENLNRFTLAYPEITQNFFDAKTKKESEIKPKTVKTIGENKKMTDYFNRSPQDLNNKDSRTKICHSLDAQDVSFDEHCTKNYVYIKRIKTG